MRRILFSAAALAGLALSAGTAPAFANALDSQLQPVASPIPRETVSFYGNEAPGTIIVRTGERRLYLRAAGPSGAPLWGRRRPSGLHLVGRHPYRLQARVARLDAAGADAQAPSRPSAPYGGGIDNPLGARAMYLAGTLYRIHGSNEPDTIGQAVSSGCIRMTNDDVVDLYSRARVGARVIVTR